MAGRGREPSHRERWVAAKFSALRSRNTNLSPMKNPSCLPQLSPGRVAPVPAKHTPLSQNHASASPVLPSVNSGLNWLFFQSSWRKIARQVITRLPASITYLPVFELWGMGGPPTKTVAELFFAPLRRVPAGPESYTKLGRLEV